MPKKTNITKESFLEAFEKFDTSKEISQYFGCGTATVSRKIKEYGLKKIKGRKKLLVDIECDQCGTTFSPENSHRKYCSFSCYRSSRCEYFKTEDGKNQMSKMAKERDTSYMQTEEYKSTLRKPDTPDYTRYKNRVHKLTSMVYEENKDKINPNNFPRTLAGVEGGYQLDHIISVREGFDRGISPEELSKLENLRMLPWKKNLARNKKSK